MNLFTKELLRVIENNASHYVFVFSLIILRINNYGTYMPNTHPILKSKNIVTSLCGFDETWIK